MSDPAVVRIIASAKNRIEGEAVQQLEQVAQLPGMQKIIGLPDLHPGKGGPIGGAFFSRATLYPYLIGNDIGCGMGLWQTDLKQRKAKRDRWVKGRPRRRRTVMESCWVQITSGRGPEECCRAAFHLLRVFSEHAAKENIEVDCLEIIHGDASRTLRSALLSISGQDCVNFMRSWEGTIQWIAQSPFRPRHKRKNWFVGVQRIFPPEEKELSSKDFKFESMRASGPGGQHVNKVNSAVRVTHFPTGLATMAQEERSQHMNKKLALSRLLAKIQEEQDTRAQQSQQEQWGMHNDLERGNPLRVFEGERFREKKG